jgi:hypothetical protein
LRGKHVRNSTLLAVEKGGDKHDKGGEAFSVHMGFTHDKAKKEYYVLEITARHKLITVASGGFRKVKKMYCESNRPLDAQKTEY